MSNEGSTALAVARRHLEQRHFERALEALANIGDQALELDEYWFMRAESLRLLDRYEEAIATAREGLRRSPEHVGLLDVLGLAHVSLGDFASADAAFRSALELRPDNTALLGHHATSLARLGKNDEARTVIATLMAIAPDSVSALQARAQVAYSTKDKLAGQYVDELLALDPENRVAHALKGNLAMRRGQATSAAGAFAEAARLDPSSRAVARVARSARIAAHPLLRPAAPLYILGTKRARVLYLAIVLGLLALHQQTFAWIVMAFWIVFVLVMPRALKAHEEDKHGQL